MGGRGLAALKDAALAGFVALVLAFPLVGFETVDRGAEGVAIHTRFAWVALGGTGVFVARLLFAAARAFVPRVARVGRSNSAARLAGPGRHGALLFGALLVAFAVALPFLPFSSRYLVDLATTVLIYIMLGWGLNVVVGLAGLLDLGYVAFYAVGAYSFALIARWYGLGFWEALPLSGLLAASFGVLLGFPVLRLRGDYLAIVTLGFGEIVRIVLLNWTDVTGGPNGIAGVPRPSFLGLAAPAARAGRRRNLQPVLRARVQSRAAHRLSLFRHSGARARHQRLHACACGGCRSAAPGRRCARTRSPAARSASIRRSVKLSAFAIGAMLGGFAGAFFATRQGFISPESFTFQESATILAIVVLGGMGSQLGVVLAAIVLVTLA